MNSKTSATTSWTHLKPLHVGILCAATALAGGLIHKYMFQALPEGARMCAKLDDAGLTQLIKETEEGVSSGQAARFVSLHTDNAILVGTEKSEWFKGTSEMMPAIVNFMKMNPQFKFTPKGQWIGCTGAWSTGDVHVQLTDLKSGQKATGDYRYTLIYRFEKGSWKIAHMHLSAPEHMI